MGPHPHIHGQIFRRQLWLWCLVQEHGGSLIHFVVRKNSVLSDYGVLVSAQVNRAFDFGALGHRAFGEVVLITHLVRIPRGRSFGSEVGNRRRRKSDNETGRG